MPVSPRFGSAVRDRLQRSRRRVITAAVASAVVRHVHARLETEDFEFGYRFAQGSMTVIWVASRLDELLAVRRDGGCRKQGE